MSLPVDDLYRDVLRSDSMLNNVGLVEGFRSACATLAYHSACSSHTCRTSMKKSVAAQLRHWQQDRLEASLGVDPRTCRSKGRGQLYVLALVPAHRRPARASPACWCFRSCLHTQEGTRVSALSAGMSYSTVSHRTPR